MQIAIPPPPGVQFIARHEWGLTDAEADRRGMDVQPLLLPEAYIHHQAGNAPDVTAVEWDDDPVAWIQRGDQSARNAGNKGYLYSFANHFADGVCSIIEGRGDRYPGATKHRNEISKAVCHAGNFDSTYGPNTRRKPHQIELDASRWLISNLRAIGWLAPDVVGRGHSQNPSCIGCTACPGDWLLPHVPYIFTPYAAPQPPAPPPPPAPEEDTMEVIQVDGDAAQYERHGFTARWAQSGPEKQRNAKELGYDPKPRRVDRSFLRSLTLVGPQPQGAGVTTSYKDFAGHTA